MELESDETKAYDLPPGVKEPEIFDAKHGLYDSPPPETFSQKDVLIENGTDSGTETP